MSSCLCTSCCVDDPDNDIGDKGAVAIAAAVKEDITLTSLDLGCECGTQHCISMCRSTNFNDRSVHGFIALALRLLIIQGIVLAL